MSSTTEDTAQVTTVPVQYRFIPGSSSSPLNTYEYTSSSTTSSNVTTTSIINPIIYNVSIENNTKIPLFNGTEYFIEDEIEGDFSELQTLFLACVATFLPLIVSLLVAFGIRLLWRKYRRYTDCNSYDCNVLKKDEQSEGTIASLTSTHCHQMRCSETQISMAETIEDDASNRGCNDATRHHHHQHHHHHHHPVGNTNGSIITMTLKNNHLIVETEERNDIEEDSRKVSYSPSTSDGVFVVEVQQGGNRKSPGSPENQKLVLVHDPPNRSKDDGMVREYVDEVGTLNFQSKTGLSQSNRSLSKSYTYGDQLEYGSGFFGYPCGYYSKDKILTRNYENNNNYRREMESSIDHIPKIISQIYKSKTSVSSNSNFDKENDDDDDDHHDDDDDDDQMEKRFEEDQIIMLDNVEKSENQQRLHINEFQSS